MPLIKLLILAAAAAGAAFAYKRFLAGPGEGYEETAQAEPFSSEELEGDAEGSEPQDDAEPGPAAESAGAEGSEAGPEDPLTHPSWLKPADAG